jgi:DNA processing protein
MKEYVKSQVDLIVADGFEELSYKNKKIFLASLNKNAPDRKKYAAFLIKNLGEGVYNKLREKICDQTYRAKVLEKLDALGVTCITFKDDMYPESLKQTPVPPLVLYCKGNTQLLKDEKFAVVGSRRTSPQMMEFGKQTSRTLAKSFTIVTGVADGADAAIMQGALESGKIICVLPNGIDRYYPAGNAALIEKVAKNGLLLSEYRPEIYAHKYFFSMSNRIVAGLAKGVLLISAHEMSGVLTVPQYATEYGRDVFAFPYSIGVSSGEGCNALIKNGATLTVKAEDILSFYGKDVKSDSVALTPDEDKLITLLRDEGEVHLERIAAALNKRAYEVLPICSSLEIKGLAVKCGGNKYGAVK